MSNQDLDPSHEKFKEPSFSVLHNIYVMTNELDFAYVKLLKNLTAGGLSRVNSKHDKQNCHRISESVKKMVQVVSQRGAKPLATFRFATNGFVPRVSRLSKGKVRRNLTEQIV